MDSCEFIAGEKRYYEKLRSEGAKCLKMLMGK